MPEGQANFGAKCKGVFAAEIPMSDIGFPIIGEVVGEIGPNWTTLTAMARRPLPTCRSCVRYANARTFALAMAANLPRWRHERPPLGSH
jgi:hypothetical protein